MTNGKLPTIAMLPAFAKIFEQIIYQPIVNHVKSIISTKQHGFVPQKSTVTNLAIITDFIANTLDEGKQVDVIYIDFEKASDRVNHNILLGKLNHYHFSPSLIRLMCSYLSNRRQSVLFKEFKSNEYTALSGIPQGSNLGP